MPSQKLKVSTSQPANTILNSITDLIKSPINIGLLLVSAFVFYKIIAMARGRRRGAPVGNMLGQAIRRRRKDPPLPELKCDLSLEELSDFDGTGIDGRILIAVNNNIYDVTCAKHLYGRTGPYAAYAGTDASRNLATFSVERNIKPYYDTLEDLTDSQMASLREWDLQFREKYPYVGKLLHGYAQGSDSD